MGVFSGTGPIRHGDYTVRLATEADVPEILALHREVFGTWPRGVDRSVFDWKFLENPYLEGVPVIVATQGEDVVGAKGHVGLEMMLGGERRLGVQSTDLMVHPDHRRAGLHGRMVDLDTELSDEPLLFFGFPGEIPTAAYRQWGRRVVSNPLYVRPLSPPPANRASSLRRAARRLGLAAHGGWTAALDRIGPGRDRFDVTVAAEPPTGRLASLYGSAVPDGIHVRRTVEFYDWRTADPLDDFSAYLVCEDGEVATAVVVSERDGTVVVRDVLPFDADADAVRAALRAIVADHRDREFVCSWLPASMDAATLWSAGFVSSRLVPGFSYSTDLVVRGVDGSWTVGGRSLADPDSWDIQLLARDY